MPRFKLVYLFIFSILLFFNAKAQINTLNPDFEALTISSQEKYASAENNKSILQLIEEDSIFKISKKNLINSGPFKHHTWLKIAIVNNSHQNDFIFEVNQTYIDSLQLFLVKEKKIIKTYPKKGLHFKANNKPSFFKNKYAYAYNINLPSNDTITLYINGIVNDGSFKVLNKIWSLNKYEDRKKEVQYKTSYLLFFGGFVFLVLVLSVFMFVFSRKAMYLYYAGFVFVIYLNILILRHFFSPLYVEKYLFFGNNFAEMIGLLQLFLMFQYFRHFFKLSKSYKKLDAIIKKLSLFAIAYFFIALFMRKVSWFYAFSFYFTKLFMVFSTILVFAIAIHLIFKKYKMAIYFVIAYAPLFFLIAHFILTAFGLTDSYNPLEWEFVVFFEVFVLTIAMAHNYYMLTQENLANISKMYTQRIKISRDLHDNIGSQLTFIKSSIDNLKYLTEATNTKLITKLNHISSFSSNTINQLRDTVWAMNKEAISLSDLCDRIQGLIEKTKFVNEQLKFTSTCSVKTKVVFPSSVGITVFRVIQEAVNNSLKYAKASEIKINITENDKDLILDITDNGIGFNLHAVELGNGLYNMQRRVKEVDGTINIQAAVNEGTHITVVIKK